MRAVAGGTIQIRYLQGMKTENWEIVKDVGAIDWNTLWSGTIGALVAGLVAAGVALYVVNRSTRNASLDVLKMMHENDRLARIARADSQATLERQLEEQRAGLTLRLKGERYEAARNRENKARAKLISQLIEFRTFDPSGLDNGRGLVKQLQASSVLWRMEAGNRNLRAELDKWPGHIMRLGQLQRHEIQLDVLGDGTSNRRAVNRFSGNLMNMAKRWSHMSSDARLSCVQSINADMKILSESIVGAPDQRKAKQHEQ